MRTRALEILGIALGISAPPAMAGRPLTTDDAAILDDKACQVEAWIDRARDASTGWFVPSCSFGAGIEWQAGFARTRAGGEDRLSATYVQAKTMLRSPREDSPWGTALALGLERRPLAQSHRGWQHPYALLSVSVTAGDATIHVQPGWTRDRERRRDTTLWGVAGELAATDRLTWLAEVFGENRDKPFVRAGARYGVVKDRLDLDLTYVTRPGGTRRERYASLGFTWQSGAFLP